MQKPRMGRPPLPPEHKAERVVLYLVPGVIAQLDALADEDARRFGRATNRAATVALLVMAAHERLARRKTRGRAR